MEPAFSQRQNQKLSLSPQLRTYLHLLHLPVMDLRQAVEEALEKNPMLEETEETLPDDWAAKEPLSFTSAPSDLSRRARDEARKARDFQETLITKPESLFDYLEWQAHFLELDPSRKKISAEILGNIAPDGYLKATLEEIAATTGAPVAAVEEVLREVQGLDPPGVGARDLREALLIQLERKGPPAALAGAIVRDHMELLAKHDWKMLSRIFSVSEQQIKAAAELISRLDPKPGRSFYAEEPIAVTPDATIAIKDGTENGLEIEMHNDYVPELRINREYRQMLRDKGLDGKTKEFLKTHLASATEFLKAIDMRRSTLRSITDEIVRAQPLFFTRGFSHLRPLRLRDIAERLDLHESTVSRAIHGKYLKTPQGTIPYKSFFSKKVETSDGEGASQKSIMERIRALIEKEDPKKPLSDQALVKKLAEEGVPLARRTVAKYRDILKILPTHLRRHR